MLVPCLFTYLFDSDIFLAGQGHILKSYSLRQVPFHNHLRNTVVKYDVLEQHLNFDH